MNNKNCLKRLLLILLLFCINLCFHDVLSAVFIWALAVWTTAISLHRTFLRSLFPFLFTLFILHLIKKLVILISLWFICYLTIVIFYFITVIFGSLTILWQHTILRQRTWQYTPTLFLTLTLTQTVLKVSAVPTPNNAMVTILQYAAQIEKQNVFVCTRFKPLRTISEGL